MKYFDFWQKDEQNNAQLKDNHHVYGWKAYEKVSLVRWSIFNFEYPSSTLHKNGIKVLPQRVCIKNPLPFHCSTFLCLL
jgi:hypothetical protein